MRNTLKSKSYFEKLLEDLKQAIIISEKAIGENRIREDGFNVAEYFRQSRASSLYQMLKLKYSMGEAIENLKNDFLTIENYTKDADQWQQIGIGLASHNKFDKSSNNEYYISYYELFVGKMSLIYLLKMPLIYLKIYSTKIVIDNVKDILLSYLINSLDKSIPFFGVENYEKPPKYEKVYKKLKEAILTDDKTKAEKLVKTYLEKDWYKSISRDNSHETKYWVGYWCWEAAAIVCIKNLDDSNFRENQFYPKDLVNFFKNQ